MRDVYYLHGQLKDIHQEKHRVHEDYPYQVTSYPFFEILKSFEPLIRHNPK